MSTFNFTIRAEDNQGAFADRQFSISVKNTMVERYMFTTDTNAYTSSDMINWTKRSGYGGNTIRHANGTWYVFTTTAGGFASNDGAIWRTFNMSSPNGYSPASVPVFINGSWYCMGRQSNSSLVFWLRSDTNFANETQSGSPWEAKTSTGGLQQPPNNHVTAVDGVAFGFYSDSIYSYNPATNVGGVVNLGGLALTGGSLATSIPYKVGEFWYLMQSQTHTVANPKAILLRSPNGFSSWALVDEIPLPAGGFSQVGSTILNPEYCNGVLYFANKNRRTNSTTIANEIRFSMRGDKLHAEVVPNGGTAYGLVEAATVRGTTYLFKSNGGVDKTTNFTDLSAATEINAAREGAMIRAFASIT